MRILVDRDKCEGLGMCEAMAHEFFEVDDDDTMTCSTSPRRRSTAESWPQRGLCPVLALSLEG